jgi:hypothetical protein
VETITHLKLLSGICISNPTAAPPFKLRDRLEKLAVNNTECLVDTGSHGKLEQERIRAW